MSDNLAGSAVAAVLERLARHASAGQADQDGAGAGIASTEPDELAEPDFTPVSVESLHRLLDGLRQLS